MIKLYEIITPIQLELLALVASGYAHDEIARIKLMSTSTIKNHLYEAKERSGARNLTHLSSLLVEQGLLRSQPDLNFLPVQEDRVIV